MCILTFIRNTNKLSIQKNHEQLKILFKLNASFEGILNFYKF